MTYKEPSSNHPDPLPQPSPSQLSIFFGPDGLRAGWSLLLFFVMLAPLVMGTTVLLKKLTPHEPMAHTAQHELRATAPRALILPEAAQLFILLIPTVIMARVERRPLAAYGIGRTPGALRQFLAGTVWGFASLSLLVLVLRATGHLTFDARELFGLSVFRYAAIWLAGFLLVGLLEEYFVRGYLQFTLARAFSGIGEAAAPSSTPAQREAIGFWIAAILFSILFGLGHGNNPGESPLGILSAGLAGLTFAYSLWRTGSLWWAIGFHAAWDWAQSFFYGVADSGGVIQGRLLITHPTGTPWLSGGTTGPEGSIFVLPTLLLVCLVIRYTLPGRPRGAQHSILSAPPLPPAL